jgi:phage-related baseplate assembly protein
MSSPIDLTLLPAPAVVEAIDFEAIYAQRKAAMIALWPAEQQAEIAATLELESEPLARLLQENAFREILLRQRINDAARAVMLAYATGTDLDQLAANADVERLTLTPADPENGVDAVMESDKDLRYRVQLAPESLSVAGPEGSYKSLTLKADPRVLDASVSSPEPATVVVTVLSREGDGVAAPDLLAAVAASLSGKYVRPLTDKVVVQTAVIVPYQVKATLYTFPGPDASVVMAEARKQLDAYIEACHRLGVPPVLSSIYAALTAAGIQRVALALPAADLVIAQGQASYCTSVELIYGGVNGA